MRSALARAAIRRGSSTMIFLFRAQGASSSASGTRVVLPAPGGATSTAALLVSSVVDNWSSTASIGRGVSKLRGKVSRPSSPAKAGDPITTDRINYKAAEYWIPPCVGYDSPQPSPLRLRRPSDTLVNKAVRRH